jgi:hypothetical protein
MKTKTQWVVSGQIIITARCKGKKNAAFLGINLMTPKN